MSCKPTTQAFWKATGRLKPMLKIKLLVALNNELQQLLVLSNNDEKWNPLLNETSAPWPSLLQFPAEFLTKALIKLHNSNEKRLLEPGPHQKGLWMTCIC